MSDLEAESDQKTISTQSFVSHQSSDSLSEVLPALDCCQHLQRRTTTVTAVGSKSTRVVAVKSLNL